ncbi:O-antigen ligase family protein [Mycobacterium kansasii]|uniref:O-antigen ligase family protein n=1 Tax=Mycobacterium kansasii TaxID=1768 RepID=UPI000C06C04E|nr:O-antigen ligase family protein [Mycobacterium kansasii]
MILYVRDRHRLVTAGVVLAVFLFGCFLVGVFAVRQTGQGLMLIAAIFSLVVYWAKPEAMVWVALFWAFAALPADLHVGKVVGPAVIYAYQAALVLAIFYLTPVVKPRFSDFAVPGLFALMVLFSTVAGLATGHAAWVVIRESTTLLEMVAGFILALLIVKGNYVKGSIHAMVVILWFSAAMAIVGSFHAVRLAGRAETLQGTGAGEALRIILSAQTPATAVLTALIAAAIVGGVRPAMYLALGPPALIITLLSFSRNPLISFAVAAVVAVLAGFSWSTLRRSVTLTAIGAVVIAVTLAWSLFLLKGSSTGAWVAEQFSAFNRRVLGGVSTGALAVDPSTLDRLREVDNLDRAIAQAPVFGHGLGYAYQLPYGSDPNEFTMKFYPTYSHLFYLWWLAKAGVVGMAAFAVFALPPLVRALRRASAPAKVSAAVSAGLLAMSTVWPLPEMPTDAVSLGLALGATMAYAGARPTGPVADETAANRAPARTGEHG